MPGGAARVGHRAFVEQHYITPALQGEMVHKAVAYDSRANDYSAGTSRGLVHDFLLVGRVGLVEGSDAFSRGLGAAPNNASYLHCAPRSSHERPHVVARVRQARRWSRGDPPGRIPGLLGLWGLSLGGGRR